MGKKVLKRKKSTFVLKPDGFSVHTFELSYELTASEFDRMKNEAYQEKMLYRDGKYRNCFRCTGYNSHGIRLSLHHVTTDAGHYHYFLRMIVNPRKLIDPESGYLGILPPQKQSIDELDKAFRQLFKGSPFPSDISQYYLSRVDLCTNLRCDNNRVFRKLVRVLHKTRTPEKYDRKKYRHQDKKKANRYNKHYIRLTYDTHELVIYDKTYQVTENGEVVAYEKLPEGVLRFEVQYKREKLRRVEKSLGLNSSTNDPLHVLWHMMQNSWKLACRRATASPRCCCAARVNKGKRILGSKHSRRRKPAGHRLWRTVGSDRSFFVSPLFFHRMDAETDAKLPAHRCFAP